jgi:predicted transcriptional regulator
VDKYNKAESNVSYQEEKLKKMKADLDSKTAPGSNVIISSEESDEMLRAIEAQEEALKKARIAASELEAEVNELKEAYNGVLEEDISNVITAGGNKEERDKAV